MQLDALYSIFQGRQVEDGTAYIVMSGSNLAEATIYGKALIRLRSRSLSTAEIADRLASGDIVKADISASEIGAEMCDPEVIRLLFSASSRSVFFPDSGLPRRMLKAVRLLGAMMTRQERDCEAADAIIKELSAVHHGFSLDRNVIKKRLEDFSNDFLVAIPGIESRRVPTDMYEVPEWLFSSIDFSDQLYSDTIFFYIFFGETFLPVVHTVVKKESGIGAKVGVARMSKSVYGSAAGKDRVIIFRGGHRVAEMTAGWHSEKKSGIQISQNDLQKFSIKDGESVSLVFTSK